MFQLFPLIYFHNKDFETVKLCWNQLINDNDTVEETEATMPSTSKSSTTSASTLEETENQTDSSNFSVNAIKGQIRRLANGNRRQGDDDGFSYGPCYACLAIREGLNWNEARHATRNEMDEKNPHFICLPAYVGTVWGLGVVVVRPSS